MRMSTNEKFWSAICLQFFKSRACIFTGAASYMGHENFDFLYFEPQKFFCCTPDDVVIDVAKNNPQGLELFKGL